MRASSAIPISRLAVPLSSPAKVVDPKRDRAFALPINRKFIARALVGVVCLMMETDSGESPLTMKGFLEMRHYKTEWCPNQSGKSGDTKPFFQVGRTKAGDRRSSSICVPNRSPGAVRPKIVSCPRFSLRCAVMRLGNGPKKICVHQRSQRIELFPFPVPVVQSVYVFLRDLRGENSFMLFLFLWPFVVLRALRGGGTFLRDLSIIQVFV